LGYASQAPFTLHFGLGGADRVEEVEIRWPSGAVERFGPAAGTGPLEADRRWSAVEGTGVLQPRDPKRIPRTPASELSVLAGSVSSRDRADGTEDSTLAGGAR
jgi:hypothetical protein